MSIFHDYYEKRKEALEEFKEEEENIASAQKDARQDQEVDFDDNSNDDDDGVPLNSVVLVWKCSLRKRSLGDSGGGAACK